MSVKLADRMERVRPYGERRIPLGPGVVWFADPDLGTGLTFPIQRLGYRVRLSGPAGAVEAFLTYTNPTAQTQNATFLFPLDRNVSPVKIKGSCGPKQFDTEVGPGPQDDEEEEKRLHVPEPLCHLFANETENVLAIPLGDIPPGGEVNLQMLLAWMVDECGEQGQGFSFRLPLMVSRALHTLDEKDLGQTELAKGLERGAQVALSIQIEASDLQPGRMSCSQTCGVMRDPNGDIAVKYDPRKPLEAKDFVLDYEVWNGNRPKAWLRSQGRHFLLNFYPPVNPTPSTPRRLVILVDGSDEMSTVGTNRLMECLSLLLNNLSAEDYFALVAFNREVSGYRNGDFVEAKAAGEALAWMKGYQFTGAADLKELLRRVVTLPRRNDSVLSVILISAGRVGNEPELYRLFQGSRDVLRLFPIMLGPKADAQFGRAAAKLTGGHAFRALSPESVSRAAERVLEHTRQPVLEGLGFQDKGLQYQGESLTPKYPSGLNWRRPITIMGAHAGRGGLEAGGSGPGGAVWSEYVEVKPSFHKLLANVWAHVKATELDDESHMLDRAERGILQNVIKNLSRDFGLLNRFTALLYKTESGVAMLPSIEARRWYRRLASEATKGKSANELLEEQKNQTDLKSGLTKQKAPGRGLRMKDALGSKSTTALFGSKLGHRNKLSNSVKDGIFSKPVLKARSGAASGPGEKPFFPGRSNGDARVSTTQEVALKEYEKSGSKEQALPVSLPDLPKPTSTESSPQRVDKEPPRPEPQPPRLDRELPDFEPPSSGLDEPAPTMRISPTIGSGVPHIRPPVEDEDEPSEDMEVSERQTIDLSSSLPKSPGLDPVLPTLKLGGEPPTLPTIGARPTEVEPPKMGRPEPPPISMPDLPAQAPSASPTPARPKLPTPRELAAAVPASARQGNQEELARSVLRADPKLRQCLMAEMRLLHGTLAETTDTVRLRELTEAVLFRLAEVAPKAELLVRAYGLGFQSLGLLDSNLDEAKSKLKFWLSRFAKLF